MLAPRAVKRKAIAVKPAVVTAATSLAAPDTEHDEAVEVDEQEVENSKTADSQAIALDAAEASGSGSTVAQDSQAGMVKQEEPSTTSVPSEENSEEPQDSDKLAQLRIAIEETLSDWGLCHNVELCQRLKASKTGYVHISNLLAVPFIASLTSVMTDITKALQAAPSEIITLDDTGFQVKRMQSPDFEQLASLTMKDWGERTFYLENIPLATRAKPYTRATLIDLLRQILQTTIEILRLPQLYDPSSLPAPVEGINTSAADATLSGLFAQKTNAKDKKGKQKRQEVEDAGHDDKQDTVQSEGDYALPAGGGTFKGFAFVVLREADKAQEAYERWSWENRGKRRELIDDSDVSDDEDEQALEEDEDEGEDEEDQQQAQEADLSEQAGEVEPPPDGIAAAKKTKDKPLDPPEKRADHTGFRMLPISAFNNLKAEYLAYSSDISLLRQAHEENKSASQSNRRRSRSPQVKQGRKKSPSPARWERKPRSPSPERWVRRALSPERAPRKYDTIENDFPRGCVVFFKRFDPSTNTRNLKALLQAILEHEEMDVDKLQYVDHVRSVDSCHIRFADAASASFFASYFSGTGAKELLHTNNSSTDPTEAFTAAPAGETRTLEAEVMTGTPETIYWSKVPLKARQTYSAAKPAAMSVDVDDDEEAYHRSMQVEAAKAAKLQKDKKRSASAEIVEERTSKREKLASLSGGSTE